MTEQMGHTDERADGTDGTELHRQDSCKTEAGETELL